MIDGCTGKLFKSNFGSASIADCKPVGESSNAKTCFGLIRWPFSLKRSIQIKYGNGFGLFCSPISGSEPAITK
ncbi:hypothetical protein DERP_003524 [Dermatophagoides pteronyssinus]|uniref:Uncharacterized protein n=1 Tax=Dermatophagoides pteronyssinus TaxID=6956 RepID=A0ABQ8JKW4_DERPT|nr:hypothetical protein DERP_003524 [Dermatophagoides pteronyssinus]